MNYTILGKVVGDSAYEVAVEQGFNGTENEWLESLKGEKGDTGNAGADGTVEFDSLTDAQIASLKGEAGTQFTTIGDDLTLESTDDGNVLQLADRPYTANSHKGKGYKILRENLVDGVNTLTQTMISSSNTIYEIRYDFDLDEQAIEIPEGCTLKFEGGSLSNGKVEGNLTTIVFQPGCLDSIYVSGTITNSYIHSSYINLYPAGDGTVDETTNQMEKFYQLSSIINCCATVTVEFESGWYGFGGGSVTRQNSADSGRCWYGYYALNITTDVNLSIKGNDACFLNVYAYKVGAWNNNDNVFTPNYDWSNTSSQYQIATMCGGFLNVYKTKGNISLMNVYVDMNKSIFDFGGDQSYTQDQVSIRVYGSGSILLQNCTVKNNVTDGFLNGSLSYEENPASVVIDNCSFSGNTRQGVSVQSGELVEIKNCSFVDNGIIYNIDDSNYQFEGSWSHIDIEPTIGNHMVGDVYITNCYFGDTSTYCIVAQSNNVRSIIVNDCIAKSSTYRKYYTDEGLVVDNTSILNAFCGLQCTEKATVSNIKLTNMALGSATILYNPKLYTPTDLPEDTSEPYYWSDAYCGKQGFISNIYMGFDEDLITEKAYILTLGTYSYNYQWDFSNNSWTMLYASALSNLTFPAAFGGCVYDNIVVNAVDKVQITIIAPGSYSTVNRIVVNVLTPLVSNDLFGSYSYTKYNYGTELIINDMCTNIQQSTLLTQTISLTEYFDNIKINRLGDANYNIAFQNNLNEKASSYDNQENIVTTQSANLLKLYYNNSHSLKLFGFINKGVTRIKQALTIGSIKLKNIGENPQIGFEYCTKEYDSDNSSDELFTKFSGAIKGLPYTRYESVEALKSYLLNDDTGSQYTPQVGESIYIIDIQKPIWWTGSAWVDSSGEEVN